MNPSYVELRAEIARQRALNEKQCSNIAFLDAEIERLQADLAEVDAMLATHAFTIDTSPPERWPKDSILKKAIDRHCARLATEKDAEG